MRESGDRRDTVKNCIKSHGPFRRQLDFIYIAMMPDALAALVSTGFVFSKLLFCLLPKELNICVILFYPSFLNNKATAVPVIEGVVLESYLRQTS